MPSVENHAANGAQLLSLVLPTREARAAAFRRCDYNGNGVLSLAEIDLVRTVLVI